MEQKINHALVLDAVSYRYEADVYAVKNVSLAIEKGSYTVILGHNGSGKSTLAKLIVGLLMPQEGSIIINGTPLNFNTLIELRHQLGIVFQNPDNQFIGATVEDDIAFGLENQCVEPSLMKGIIDKYSTQVGMNEFLQKEPTHLSGGQKQRVAIAGVLAMAPSIIIFDEATSMLDPKGREEIKELIKEMRLSHPELTLLSITHDIEEAWLADQVVIMNQGEMYKVGTPAELLTNEEELATLQLAAPFAVQLSHLLQHRGFTINTEFTIEGSVNAIWPSISNK